MLLLLSNEGVAERFHPGVGEFVGAIEFIRGWITPPSLGADEHRGTHRLEVALSSNLDIQQSWVAGCHSGIGNCRIDIKLTDSTSKGDGASLLGKL